MHIRRWIRRLAIAFGVVLVVLVVALIAGLTIDLGPVARAQAESRGSKLIQRKMTIERLGIRLGRGDIVLDGLKIEGLTATDKPFLTAKRIAVALHWWTFFRTRDILIKSVEMSDWDMQVEMKDGHDSFIKLPKGSGGQKRVTVTLERVHAYRGRFTYIDHGTWSTTSPNLDVTVTREYSPDVDRAAGNNGPPVYTGRANFSDGRVKIKEYETFRSDMRCAFRIEDGRVHLHFIDLKTDGAQSVLQGDVDLREGHWPEMLYRVKSHVEFPRMRDIFFHNEKFRLHGEGEFTGTFHLYKGGREVKGAFSSPMLKVNAYEFPNLAGEVDWLPERLDVTRGSARFHSGTAQFTYSIAPIGAPTPAIARLDAAYQNVDLASFSDFLQTRGLRLAGRASGRNILEYPLGKWGDHRGEGEVRVRPPANAAVYTRTSQPAASVVGPPVPLLATPAAAAPPGTAETAAAADKAKPGGLVSYVGPVPDLGHVPIAGSLRYTYGPEWVDVAASSIATPGTYVEFSGRTAYGERSSIDFYARSGDWQQSDNLLSAVITAFGSPTRTVIVGGYGEFTGRLINSFRRPHIEGRFTGHGVRAFDVLWGDAQGQVVIDNGYVDVTDGVVAKGKAELHVPAGRFSLSTPREDHGEEINTRITLKDWPIPDLRHAFDLDAYPIDGRAGGEYHVTGAYRRPYGYGLMTVANGVAYNEPFDRGAASLRLEGTGVRLEGIEMVKGGGLINGSASVTWDGRYSFTADGRRIPVEQLNALKFPQAPLSGLAAFKASGSGAFANPRYELEFSVPDLFIGDEGVGYVGGKLNVQNQILGLERFETSSLRLAVSGTGRISMTPGADADLRFTVTDAWLDPYIRTLQPGLSPFNRVEARGTVHIVGPLSDPMRLLVDADVDQLHLSLFDYDLQNDGRLHLALNSSVVSLTGGPSASGPRPPLRLVGRDTRLSLAGDINLGDMPYVDPRGGLVAPRAMNIDVEGDANLGILQGFFRDIRSSGRATVNASVTGSLDAPAFSGRATIKDGRLRYYSLPHSIDAINGPIMLSAGAIRFGEPSRALTAQVGGGTVTLGGRIDLNGLVPTQWALKATGDNLHLRYPEGFNSTVDVDLDLAGPYASPTLRGTVNVTSGVFAKTLEITPQLFLAAGGGGQGVTPASAPVSFPLRFDVRILARSSLRVQSNLAKLVASADLTLRGTYDRPVLLGRADIERGYAMLLDKRYQVTHGAIEFRNPGRIEPDFDIETETRVRVPGQTYLVNLHLVGTLRRIQTLDVSSDPPLPSAEAWSLLFGDMRAAGGVQNAELRELQRPNATQQQILTTQLQQLIVNAATTGVSRDIERTFGLDTFQLTPSFFDAYQRLNPTARLTIGKQISDRVYLTISRSLYAPQEDIIYLLQYDQNDRVSWVLSRNEDKTYSLDVRVRHTF